MPSNFDRIKNQWEGRTNNTNPPINNSNTQSTTASIHNNGNSSIDNNNNNSERSVTDDSSANNIPPPPHHINTVATATHDTSGDDLTSNADQEGLVDAIAINNDEGIKTERFFLVKEENAHMRPREDNRRITQQFWTAEGEGRSRGSRRSGSRATQSISNSNVYHPNSTASSPQRPLPVRPNNAHSPPKGTPGRSKAIRLNEGSNFTSRSSCR